MSRQPLLSPVRTLATLVIGLLLFGACDSEALLGPEGVAGEWLAATEETVPPTEEDVLVSSGLRTSLSALWPNDPLSVAATVPDEGVVGVIWENSGQVDRFVQVSRSDISKAIPDIRFPELIPDSVEFISTQLIFFPRTGGLDSAPAAAFGLWTVSPYSLSRSVGQKAVIFVHVLDQEVSFEGDITQGCGQFQARELSSCERINLGLNPAWWLSSLEGNILVWYSGELRYEMTIRPPVTRAIAEQVASSSVPLGTQLPADRDL
jgi:hypothetical protein